jgi:single-strand DNA-binding protein
MAVVEGRLQVRDWTDRDGAKRRTTEVVADNVYFGDSKRSVSESDTAPASQEPRELPESEKGDLPF